jgi:hypothetical protein
MLVKNNIYFKKDGYLINFQLESNNSKTGNMVQNFIFPLSWFETDKHLSKLDDSSICFDCVYSQSKTKGCYVRKGFANMSMWGKIKSIRKIGITNIPDYSEKIDNLLEVLLSGKGIRFGSYGEPILLGEKMVQKICGYANFWTGYTHQFHKHIWSNKYFMASVESDFSFNLAKKLGFRVFYIVDSMNESKNFIHCPASKEMNKKANCDTCKLCMGLSSKAKDIKILKH